MDNYSVKAAEYLKRKIQEAEASSKPENTALKQKAREAFTVLERATDNEIQPALDAWLVAVFAHLAVLGK